MRRLLDFFDRNIEVVAIIAIDAAIVIAIGLMIREQLDEGDAPPAERTTTPGWTIIRAPDDFGDVAISPCVDGYRVFVSEDDTRVTSAIYAMRCEVVDG